ncbi:hypothetical protein B7463_g8025, partial [Scytalidium lignicola]
MDETGFRVGVTPGEEVIVPVEIKELYEGTFQNRKSVTVIECVSADGKASIPPVILVEGVWIMENWAQDNLPGNARIIPTEKGYTNNQVGVIWLQHFIKYSGAKQGVWHSKNHKYIDLETGQPIKNKLLLVDGHESHESREFIELAEKYHIIPLEFPSHLTHIIQPLDVKVFRPYKWYHKRAIREALGRLEPEYTVTSFLRDLTKIREHTFTELTIRHAFRDSGIWPIEVSKTLSKLRTYSIPDQPKELTLPTLPSTPRTVRHGVQALEELETRIPETEQSIVISSWKQISEVKARSRKRITKNKDGGYVADLREKLHIKKQQEEAALQKQAQITQRKQEAQIKKIYKEELKEWNKKERERKAAIRRITQGRKTKEHLVPASLLVTTPNKPVDPATFNNAILSVDEEQEVDFVLESTYNSHLSQLDAVENGSERLVSMVNEALAIDPILATVTTTTAQYNKTTATKENNAKPSWMDQDFVEFLE